MLARPVLPLETLLPRIRRPRIEMFPMLIVALWELGSNPTLGDDVVAYARSKLGQKVGNGECTSLAVDALRQCHARRPDPVMGIWGDEVKSLRDLQPGDILQFEEAIFESLQTRGGSTAAAPAACRAARAEPGLMQVPGARSIHSPGGSLSFASISCTCLPVCNCDEKTCRTTPARSMR